MTMKSMLRAGSGLLALMTSVLATQALAQSTGTQTVEEVLVTAKKRDQSIGGNIVAVQVPKARSTITQQYLTTQTAGESVIQSLNLVPGLNFTNNDPYGSSGGNLRIRSYDNARIALLLDGMTLNDTGNYAIYTNQQIDSEIIDRTDVNLGTTDVDAPTASATGGTINIITQNPLEEFGGQGTFSLGSFDYRRIFGRLDTGRIGANGPTAYVTGSWQNYDKFKGPGDLEKSQINGKILQTFNGDDFVAVAAHFNQNRNNFYRNLTRRQIQFYGDDYDNLATCNKTTGGPGTQNDGASLAGTGGGAYLSANDNPANAASCTNYYGIRINPSDTGNIRIQSKFTLTDKLTLTVDPNFQYVLANGGGTTVLSETDNRLKGNGGPGVDLNFDGDTSDSVRLHTPNTTNTRRWGVNTSLIYKITPENLFRFAYTFDYGLHRQTGQYSYLDALGNPVDVFAGINGQSIKVSDGSGADLRGRDRRSIAKLNQFAFNYDGRYFNNMVHLDIGLRMPFFERNINQFCYTAIATGSQYCTSGNPGPGYVAPYSGTKHYNKLLPNAGISVKPFGDNHIFYANYAQGLSAPRTDNLYSLQIVNVQPEKTEAYDLGYRYQSDRVLGSVDLWRTDYSNRIVTSFDEETRLSIDRNVGRVRIWGVDAEMGTEPFKNFTVYGTASYNHSTLKDNLQIGAGPAGTIKTKGNALVETPTWTFGGRLTYKIAGFDIGVQGKYVSGRYATDDNAEKAPAYAVFDGNVRYAFDQWGVEGTYVQFNVINMFDRNYLGSINSQATIATNGGPTYAIGAPRTFQFSVHTAF